MGDPKGSKTKSIPSWQLKDDPAASDVVEDTSTDESKERRISDRAALVEQASKFLEDEGIRNAPIERKKTFLESKGLTEAEIGDLLQPQEQEQHITPEAEVMEDYGIEKDIAQMQSSKTTSSPAQQVSPPAAPQDAAPRDMAPIITYPEFLLHSQQPPPLITARRLLTTLYATSGIAAAIYGTSKYIVEPMIGSLTSARHSLAETASTNLDTLNLKLEGAVSKVPEALTKPAGDDDSDVESVDLDPARFFKRSAGTQTSPRLSRSNSSDSSSSTAPRPPLVAHENSLSTIHSRLFDLVPSDAKKSNPVKESIDDLKKYLDGLSLGYNIQQNGKLWEKSKVDEYAKLKNEIRGVKGVLLSARNFPSGVAVR